MGWWFCWSHIQGDPDMAWVTNPLWSFAYSLCFFSYDRCDSLAVRLRRSKCSFRHTDVLHCICFCFDYGVCHEQRCLGSFLFVYLLVDETGWRIVGYRTCVLRPQDSNRMWCRNWSGVLLCSCLCDGSFRTLRGFVVLSTTSILVGGCTLLFSRTFPSLCVPLFPRVTTML